MRALRPPLAALLALALGAAGARAATGPEFRSPEGAVRLVSAWQSAPAGGDARLGLEFDLAPGWHVYWKNAGDAGYPPELLLAEGSPLGAAELRYPAPERYELPGELVAFGYSDRMIYPIDAALTGAPPGPGGPARISATLDYLVCAESCVPYTAELRLDLPVGAAVEDPDVAERLAGWRARLPRPAAELERVDAELARGEGSELELRLTLVGEGVRASAPDLFFETHPLLDFGRPRFAAGAAGPGFAVALRPLDETRALPERLTVAWTATGFERGGHPAAWEGTADLEPPRAGARRLLPLIVTLLVAAALAALARPLLARIRTRR